jgi:hypothetical protein
MKLHRNFGYMVKQLKDVPEEEWCERGRAILEHHFENHQYCGEWCSRRNKTVSELQTERTSSGKYFHCKERDAAQYKVLKAIMDKYITIKKLK